MGDTGGEITPPDRTDMIADGQDNVTLKWPLKYGSDSIRDHSVEWKMVDVLDENGVSVDAANYADYGHISSGTPDADGTYTAIYTTGTKGGSVSFDAIDDSVYVKDSSATASSPGGLSAQSVSATSTTSSVKPHKKKNYKSANPKGFSRPGSLTLLGSPMDSPAWLQKSVSVTPNGSRTSSDAKTDLKVLGIRYTSNSDRQLGRALLHEWSRTGERCIV